MKKTLLLLSAASLFMASCGDSSSDGSGGKDSTEMAGDPAKAGSNEAEGRLKPKGPKPAWAPDMDDEMAAVIEKLGQLSTTPLNTLTAPEARMQPTPTDAVMALIQENNIQMPAPMCDTMGQDIPVSGGTVHTRVYKPREANGPLPVIVYFHGGGWVIADLNTYDASAKGLCEGTKAIVVSVHYRQGPEHKFPTAHNDAFAAYQWVLKNAASMGGDPKRVAVAGESAGGNLACNVSIMARDKGVQMPVHQMLVYPVANNDSMSASMQKWGTAKPLDVPLLKWMLKNFLANPAQSGDPRIALVKANLKGLPATTIVAAEIDVLMSEGELLRDKLKEAGVAVDYKLYNGVTHEFFGMAAVVPDAKDAQAYASDKLKGSLK